MKNRHHWVHSALWRAATDDWMDLVVLEAVRTIMMDVWADSTSSNLSIILQLWQCVTNIRNLWRPQFRYFIKIRFRCPQFDLGAADQGLSGDQLITPPESISSFDASTVETRCVNSLDRPDLPLSIDYLSVHEERASKGRKIWHRIGTPKFVISDPFEEIIATVVFWCSIVQYIMGGMQPWYRLHSS
jgi:hypothetical protein